MNKAEFETMRVQRAQSTAERKRREQAFNAEVARRYQAGESKAEIMADLQIGAEVFRRAVKWTR